MKLSDIDRPKNAEIDFGDGEVLNITYHASRLTPKLEEELEKVGDSQQMIEMIVLLVESWDLVEEDGTTVVALEPERLSTIPLLALSAVVRGMALDISKDVSSQGKR
jgi:hypothetical protein